MSFFSRNAKVDHQMMQKAGQEFCRSLQDAAEDVAVLLPANVLMFHLGTFVTANFLTRSGVDVAVLQEISDRFCGDQAATVPIGIYLPDGKDLARLGYELAREIDSGPIDSLADFESNTRNVVRAHQINVERLFFLLANVRVGDLAKWKNVTMPIARTILFLSCIYFYLATTPIGMEPSLVDRQLPYSIDIAIVLHRACMEAADDYVHFENCVREQACKFR